MFTLEQLTSAWLLVRAGTKTAGVDGITLDLFASAVNDELRLLLRQLQQESYRASPAKGFYLAKSSGGKRLIGIPTVRDRIVQRLLLEELYFPLEDTFLDCSYAYRPGRNIQQAVQHLYSYYQLQPKWIIKADIADFFDSLCWPLLLTAVQALPLEPIVVQLLEGQLRSGIVIAGKPIYPGKGVLQGGVLSGALGNLYLNEFDRKCLSHSLNLVRYGDDFAIACSSWLEASRTLDKVTNWLGELYLNLQPDKTQIYAPNDEFTFLGYRFAGGEVYAPPSPVTTREGEWVTNQSGLPYFRPKERPVKFASRPPKACSIDKPSKFPTASISHIWQDFMSTLYVTDQGAYLSVKNQQFQVFYQGELKLKIPATRVSNIILFGCCNVSHGAVNMALWRRIPVMYLSQKGRYFGRLQTEGDAKVEYLMRQVDCARNEKFTRQQAEAIVTAKLHNSRILIMRLNRRRSTENATQAIDLIEVLIDSLPQAESMEALRGYEGKAATVYFQALGSLFTGFFAFDKRTKRPPTDPINSLMSLGYTLLSQQVFSFIQATGLHTHFGNLHVPRDNHPALVSDLMEEFRAQIVDSFVAYLVNKKILDPEDFTPPDERGGVYLQASALKKYLKHWEEKLQTETTHPHTGYKVAYRRCIELQVREYVACLMGEVEVYRPMVWKL
ncbi:CRISPR-associated endonuclease Cas1 [Nostoc sp. 'Peltigera membranacea cyanobiont' 213]|uniref:CRISPR-associated endonuclease Cas1 n=1 Tax=Nostoc sp. 'Peltigera membranacea cyanobiont' 213 TaxID=2014530 RepID=UPI000B95A18A|nr:CRISPR-associated endonuclease Cas1 [Nostoc sp. 'Peltigera membranacea cyanobiont' 213]OYD87592.1 CRISPR-associated endonuclease Cas1 [Nostoc sp. 'Peltigera membranacea cyanobiont' 213]